MTLDVAALMGADPTEFARAVKAASDSEIKEAFAGPQRGEILDEIFGRFPGLFRADQAQGVSARVNWRVTGGAGDSVDTYAVVVDNGACTIEKDPSAEPDTSIQAGPVEFLKLITGTGNPVMMVMTGKVKARGDVALAMASQNWFEVPKA